MHPLAVDSFYSFGRQHIPPEWPKVRRLRRKIFVQLGGTGGGRDDNLLVIVMSR
jgi:hypothetical protein